MAGGAVVTAVVGFVDVRFRSPVYYDALQSNVHEMLAATLAVSVAGAALVLSRRALARCEL